MADKNWKRIERKVAEALDGKRVPMSGNGAIKGDVVQMRLVPGAIGEVKHGKQVVRAGPKQLSDWMKEAERDADTAAATGALLVTHPPRARVLDSFVVTRLGVFADALRHAHEVRL